MWYTFFFSMLTVVQVTTDSLPSCMLSVPLSDVMSSFQHLVPTADGSFLAAPNGTAGVMLLQNIHNNVHAIGVDMTCDTQTCVFSVPDTQTHANVFMLAVLGNFLNVDLDPGDAIAHIRIDTSTGLLRRVHAPWWTRTMLTDTLLILAVVILVKRSFEQQQQQQKSVAS